jgi:ubiquinone/menaquinone biosynthesis C-methylase UbiE
METIWTIAGDETSWPGWASRMATSTASETMKQLASDLTPGSQQWALDIGCGTGRSFLPLNQNGYQVIGIDPIHEAIIISQSRAKNENLSAWPIWATADWLPIRNESIKAIFAIGTLYHLSPIELEKALTEIKRVLLVGGEAILHFLDLDDWRRKLGKQIRIDDIPMPSYQAVVTCFCSEDVIRTTIHTSGITVQNSVLKTQYDEEGERRDWFFHCVRQR